MNKFEKRICYRLLFTLVSPLSVGSGENESTDHDIIVDASGRPFIPATAIAGVIRHSLTEKTAKELFGYVPSSKEEKEKDPDKKESRIMVYDARIQGEDIPFFIAARDSVALENKVSVRNAKFDSQALEPGVELVSYIELLDKKYASVLENAFAEINGGDLRFGAKTTRGCGKVKLSVKKTEISDFETYADFAIYDEEKWAAQKEYVLPDAENNGLKLVLSVKNRGGISIREYSTDVGMPDYETISIHDRNGKKNIPVIPGTSWAGAIRGRFFEFAGKSKDDPDELFGFVDKKGKEKPIKSKIVFSETVLSGGTFKESTRNSIDRFSGATKDRALYTERTYFNGKGELEIIILRPLSAQEKFMLAAVLADLNNGFLAVGGLTAVGRGLFEIEKVNGSEETAKLLSTDSLDIEKFIGEVFGA